jgi:transposase
MCDQTHNLETALDQVSSFQKEVDTLKTSNDYLVRENQQLKQENQRLKEQISRLMKDSSTSSKPPSSDVVKPKKLRTKGSRKEKGGQPGHEKHERPLFCPDQINIKEGYFQEKCPHCYGLLKVDFSVAPKVIQQIEIKESPIDKYEHLSYACWCPNCQVYHYASFPEEVIKEGLFKSRITALVAYMKHICHCSFSNIRKYIRDVLGEKISRGYLSKIIQKVSQSLEGPYEELLKLLPLATKVNVDETGHKENGDKFWTWVFRTDLYVLFKIDKSRGSKVLLDVLGNEFNGILGCDYFSAYRKYMKDFNTVVQFCIAHLIRDIRFLISQADSQIRGYGEKLLAKIKGLFGIIHNRDNMPTQEFVDKLTLLKDQIIYIALKEVPIVFDKNGKEQKTAALNMAIRFAKHGHAYFEFITSPDVEPTNNLAEQAIRFVVIDRHVTQGTRSQNGRQACERIWTVIATCSLQGKSAFNFILKAVHANFSNQSPPSLIFDSC